MKPEYTTEDQIIRRPDRGELELIIADRVSMIVNALFIGEDYEDETSETEKRYERYRTEIFSTIDAPETGG